MYAQHHSHDHDHDPVPGLAPGFGSIVEPVLSNGDALDQVHAGPVPGPTTPVLDQAGGDCTAQHTSRDHIELGGTDSVQVGDNTLTTGEINCLADYVGSPEELAALTPGQLARARELLAKEPLTPEEMAELTAIFPRYQELSLANGNHFGDSDPDLCAASGDAGPTHRTEIGRWLSEAASLAAAGDLDGGLAAAAFGGHFIADAFSSGHLFNKADVQAEAQEGLTEGGVLDAADVPAMVLGAGQRIAVEGASKLRHWRAQVGGEQLPVSAAMLTGLLAGAVAASPELIQNSVVLAVHDQLSADGVMVSDGEVQWRMFGDHALDATSLQRCSALIERAYGMVRACHQQHSAGAMDADAIAASLPVPIECEKARIADEIDRATTVEGGGMEDAIVHSSVALLDDILAGANDEVPGVVFVRVEADPTLGELVGPLFDLPEGFDADAAAWAA